MNINVKLNKRTLESYSIPAAIDKIRRNFRNCVTYSSSSSNNYSSAIVNDDRNVAYAYSIQKIRGKKVRLPKVKSGKRKGEYRGWKKEPTKVIVTYYEIPIELLKVAKLKLVQESKTFKLIPMI